VRPLRPTEILENPARYLHKVVEVEIVEPLSGALTAEALTRLEYGQVDVRIPEGPAGSLVLVPAAFKLEDPDRYKNKFDRVITSPVRVRGELLRDEELSKAYRRPAYVIRVSAIEPLRLESPELIRSLSQIQSNPAAWDRKLVTYEGVYESRFEVSALDRGIWLDFAPGAAIIGRPAKPDRSPSHGVRVTGTLFARPGASYGHLGAYHFELIASKVEYLDGGR
jgi:hypothetical protein